MCSCVNEAKADWVTLIIKLDAVLESTINAIPLNGEYIISRFFKQLGSKYKLSIFLLFLKYIGSILQDINSITNYRFLNNKSIYMVLHIV